MRANTNGFTDCGMTDGRAHAHCSQAVRMIAGLICLFFTIKYKWCSKAEEAARIIKMKGDGRREGDGEI